MTQPPDEPPPEPTPDQTPPDPGWQPPGPPPEQQPPVQNPYGAPSTSYYQPVDSGGMSNAVKVVLGAVIGVAGGFFLWLAAAIAFASTTTGEDTGFLFFAAVTPLVVPAPLLIWKATRPWGVGLLIGTAISCIGMSGLCASLISSA